MKMSESKLRKVIRKEVSRVLNEETSSMNGLTESNKYIDTAKDHANNLMQSLTQAQMEDDGVRGKEISNM